MFRIQYLLPVGSPAADGCQDKPVADVGVSLNGVDRKWTAVTNYVLSLKLKILMDSALHEIKMRDQLVYVSHFVMTRTMLTKHW